jgi:hypothetical protein
MNVHRKLGSGFSAAVHKEALEKEFIKHNIPDIEKKYSYKCTTKANHCEKNTALILFATKSSF